MDTNPGSTTSLRRILGLAGTVVLLAAACASDDPVAGSDGFCELRSPGAADAPADDHDAPADDHGAVDWIVDIDMFEFGYSCEVPPLDAGTVLQINFTNIGAIEHEAVIGDIDVQREHEAEMADGQDSHDQDGHGDDGHADDGHGHDGHGDTPAIRLASGESGSIVVELDEPGELIIGCHIPGHWDAGMHNAFTVRA